MDNWKTVDQYHLRNNNWTIAKMKLANGTKYALYHQNENHGFYDSAEDAKQRYEELIK